MLLSVPACLSGTDSFSNCVPFLKLLSLLLSQMWGSSAVPVLLLLGLMNFWQGFSQTIVFQNCCMKTGRQLQFFSLKHNVIFACMLLWLSNVLGSSEVNVINDVYITIFEINLNLNKARTIYLFIEDSWHNLPLYWEIIDYMRYFALILLYVLWSKGCEGAKSDR